MEPHILKWNQRQSCVTQSSDTCQHQDRTTLPFHWSGKGPAPTCLQLLEGQELLLGASG